MYTTGYITEIEDGQGFHVYVPFADTYLLEKWKITEAEIRLDDGRNISNKQRRSIYKIIREISNWCGHIPEEIKEYLKFDFELQSGIEWFSLSDVDMTTARYFQRYLVEFCLVHGVTFSKGSLLSFIDEPEEIAHYVYKCIECRKCALCGLQNADIHHCEGSRVGMGRDRTQIIHEGLKCIPLCRIHHNECHASELDFMEKHHIFGIKLDQHLCEVLGLNFEAS